MLITKFNALIRNRFVWGFFAVIVSITMVGFFTDIEGCVQGKKTPGGVGELSGQSVSYSKLQAAKFNVIMRLRLATGRDFNLTPELNTLVTREAWKRLAMLQLAEAEKLGATDGEVVSALQRDPMFQENGVFSPERYAQFRQILAQNYRIDALQFEDYMREELALDKIRRAVSSSIWTAPYEVDRLARNFADSFTVAYAEEPRSTLTRDVTVSDAQVRAFYDTHAEAFTIPDKVQVAYAAFPFSDYTASVTVTAEAVTNYYSEHLNDYFTTNAAGEPAARKIEEVEAGIRDLLATATKRDQAIEAAAFFADSLYGRSGDTNFFYAAAAATGKTVRLTRFFTAQEPLNELLAGIDFNSAAFALSPEKDSNFSEPIAGSNAVYILAYEGTQPSRLPAFEEVRTEAHGRALAEARNLAFADRSAALQKKIRTAIQSGSSFEDAVKAANFGEGVKTAGPFTAYTAPAPFDNARLVTAVIALQEGELSDLIPSERNTLFLVLVKARTPGDTTAADPIRNQIRSSLNRRHAQLVVSQWEEDLLKKKGYQEPVEETIEDTAEPDTNDKDGQAPIGAGTL
jgi:peptidyl-prolyl cis-trans isomerase D